MAESNACARDPQQDDRPAGPPTCLLFLPGALGSLPTVIVECFGFRSCVGAPTYPGKGPEALEDGPVACAATQVSCGPREKAALSAQTPGQERACDFAPDSTGCSACIFCFLCLEHPVLFLVFLTSNHLSLLPESLPRLLRLNQVCLLRTPPVPGHGLINEFIKLH